MYKNNLIMDILKKFYKTENLSDEELKMAIDFLLNFKNKDFLEKNIIGDRLSKTTREIISLLVEATWERENDSESLNLIKNGTLNFFKAWISECGELEVGFALSFFYHSFESIYSGMTEELVEKGKDAVKWLFKELDLETYLDAEIISKYLSNSINFENYDDDDDDDDDENSPF